MELGLETDNIDLPLTDVDEFIKFEDNSNTSYSISVRPDIWILPFINLYGVFGYGRSQTTVNLSSPIEFTSVVEQELSTAGFGAMGAFGIGPVWLSVDGNWTWNKPALLDKPVRVAILGVRVGKSFAFKRKPDRNIAIWGGGMRVKMGSTTVGQIQLVDALPPEVWDKRDETVAKYDAWYNDLPALVQAKVDATPIPNIVDRIEQADGSAIIKYGMDKQVLQKWNGVFGAQFQYNKHWMLRTEWGLIGDRKSGLISLNYRFLL
jgi:hypothetical protein